MRSLTKKMKIKKGIRSIILLYLCRCGTKTFNCFTNVSALTEEKALDKTIIVAATASDLHHYNLLLLMLVVLWENTSVINGQHALIIYDDLSKQAVAYRQMSFYFVVRLVVKLILVMFSIFTLAVRTCC